MHWFILSDSSLLNRSHSFSGHFFMFTPVCGSGGTNERLFVCYYDIMSEWVIELKWNWNSLIIHYSIFMTPEDSPCLSWMCKPQTDWSLCLRWRLIHSVHPHLNTHPHQYHIIYHHINLQNNECWSSVLFFQLIPSNDMFLKGGSKMSLLSSYDCFFIASRLSLIILPKRTTASW